MKALSCLALLIASMLVINVQSADQYSRYKFKQETDDEDSLLEQGAQGIAKGVNNFHKRLGCEV